VCEEELQGLLMKNTMKIVALGLSLVLTNLSGCYAQDFGKGMKAYLAKDYATALREFRSSAAQGDAFAQYSLGFMYSKGYGVIQDNVYAHMWWDIAASSGDANAVNNRDIVASIMPASQLEEAHDLVRACVKKNYKGC